MPKPIVCLSEPLRQFVEIFRSCFSQRQWKYFVIVLLGWVECEERKTLSGLLRRIGEPVSLSGLSRFLNKWSWSPQEVAQSWLRHFRQRLAPWVQTEHTRLKAEQPKRLGRPKQTVVTGFLIFDDSVHEKPKGRKMRGLGRHYSNTDQKVVTGHCLFSGLYVVLGQRCPLRPRLDCQQKVCEQEKQPFQSKVAMVVEEIETFEPVPDTQTQVLIDSWYHCKQVRRAAQQRDWQVSGALTPALVRLKPHGARESNRVMRLIAEDGSRMWIHLSQYAAGLTRADWSEVTWPAAEGGQKMDAHLMPTWIRTLGPTLLLIPGHDLDAPLKSVRYWGSTLLDLEAQAFVDILAVRWEIETFFEYDKDLLGSDHYPLMSAQAILRFWTLTACLMCFLEEQRTCAKPQLITCGEARRKVQDQHRTNLLVWLKAQFQANMTIEQISSQLALCSS